MARFRLIKRPAAQQLSSISKRLKSIGDEFELRELTLYRDKMQTNDEIHQSIEVCPVMKALVDTEAFQRLRNIRQLGTSEYLYTCANGNRFQHSLGVAHLAERMCKTIKDEQPNLGATHKDVLCVKLAGLLHDIGHGPFSHLYEAFRNRALPAYLEANPDLLEEYEDCERLLVPDGWSHEQSSLQMIDAALEELGLQIDLDHLDQPLKQIGNGIDANSMKVFKPLGVQDSILTSRDFVFIKECILGRPLPEVMAELDKNELIGRTEETKEWLYDIVNNRYSGLDVDKIDYFARDHVRAMGSGSIDNKMVEDARVAKALGPDGREHYMICYPLKRVEAAMNFFKKRLHLHTIIYQNKKTVAVASMLCDIFCSADPYFRMVSDDGEEKYPISRAVLKSSFLMPLDDNVLRDIARSTDPELEEARALCRRLRKHDIYKCAVDQPLDIEVDYNAVDPDRLRDRSVWQMPDHEIKRGMMDLKRYWKSDNGEAFPLEARDFTIEKYFMHHGKKDKNPLSGMRFFDEMNEKLIGPIDDLPKATPVDESKYRSIIPMSSQKAGVRVFCREESKRERVHQVFLQWFERLGKEDVHEAETTPDPSVKSEEDIGEASTKLKLHEDSDDDDDDDEQEVGDNGNLNAYPAVMLSQDSDDEDEDDRSRPHAQLDQSPIPVRSR